MQAFRLGQARTKDSACALAFAWRTTKRMQAFRLGAGLACAACTRVGRGPIARRRTATPESAGDRWPLGKAGRNSKPRTRTFEGPMTAAVAPAIHRTALAHLAAAGTARARRIRPVAGAAAAAAPRSARRRSSGARVARADIQRLVDAFPARLSRGPRLPDARLGPGPQHGAQAGPRGEADGPLAGDSRRARAQGQPGRLEPRAASTRARSRRRFRRPCAA